MAEKHPNELELLSFAEEELDPDASQDVAEHLVACRTCADEIRRLEAARETLRAAPLLELPASREAAIMASLPERRDPWRLFRPVKRVLVIAAPVAAAAAVVGVLVVGGTQLGGGGDEDSGEAVAEATAEDAAGGQAGGATTIESEAAPAQAGPPGTTFLRFAQGPPAEIVRVLENAGIAAEADPSAGVVAVGSTDEVTAALENRPTGDVAVYIR
jgi:anti-sigma factor RsiW